MSSALVDYIIAFHSRGENSPIYQNDTTALLKGLIPRRHWLHSRAYWRWQRKKDSPGKKRRDLSQSTPFNIACLLRALPRMQSITLLIAFRMNLIVHFTN